jgi:hypothetical protein
MSSFPSNEKYSSPLQTLATTHSNLYAASTLDSAVKLTIVLMILSDAQVLVYMYLWKLVRNTHLIRFAELCFTNCWTRGNIC